MSKFPMRRNGISKKLRRAALMEARAILARPKGWIKDASKLPVEDRFEKDGRTYFAYCSTGAIHAAIPYSPRVREAVVVDLSEVLKSSERYGNGHPNVVGFNDHPSTRKKDVLRMFDEAIEALA